MASDDAPLQPDAELPFLRRPVLSLEEQVRHLEAQVLALSQEKLAALEMLDYAALSGVIRPDADRATGVRDMLRQTAEKLRHLLPLTAVAFYLVDEEDAHFEPAFCQPETHRAAMELETDALIEENAFAWALTQRKPRLLTARHVPGKLFLHPLATASRIRGMCVGLMDPAMPGLMDLNLSLASMLLLSCSSAIESFEVHAYIKDVNSALRANVEKLADSERQLLDHRERLEQEVAARTSELSAANAELTREIAVRQATEEALLRERDFVRAVLDTAGALILVLDSQGVALQCNKAFAALSGLDETRIKGRPFLELVQEEHGKPGSLAELRRRLRELAESPGALRAETRLVTRAGSRRSISWSLTTLGDPVLGMVATGLDMTEQKSAEDALRDSEARFRAVFTEAGMGIAVFDAAGFCLDCNPRLAQLLCRARKDLLGKQLHAFAHPEDAPDLESAMRQLFLAEAPATRLDMRFLNRKGRRLWVQLALSRVSGRGGGAAYGILLLEDVTKRREMEDALRAAEATYRTIFENAVEGVFQSAASGRFLAANRAMAAMFGYATPHDLMTGAPDARALLCADGDQRDQFFRLLLRHGEVDNHEMEARRRDGRKIWISVSARAVLDEAGALERIEGLVEDITDRKASEMVLQRKATLDELTGIPNRYLFLDRFEQHLAQSRRLRQPLALLYIDLDEFKHVNDTFGHHVGDAVLQEAARRLRDRVRKSDLVARLGGDEFTVLLHGVRDLSDVTQVADDIIEALRAPCEVLQVDAAACCTIGASIGISLWPRHGDDPDTLLRKADAAMYLAKNAGGNRWRVHGEEGESACPPVDEA